MAPLPVSVSLGTIERVPDYTLFIDDGGVLNDNARRGPEFLRLIAEFFPPRLGGTPEAWGEANRATFRRVIAEHEAAITAPDAYLQGYETYERAWLRAMCEYVGVTPPEGNACGALAREALLYITSRARAAFPGAAEMVAKLAGEGYTLHTGSNQASWEMEGYLSTMGIRDYFGFLFGADLVNVMKPYPAYYERAFALAEVDPARALVLDDSPGYLDAAREVGARTVLVGPAAPSGHPAIPSLAALPALLETLT